MAQDKYEEKEKFDGTKVKVLIPTYIEGTDQDRYQWRVNISRVNLGVEADPVAIKYLKTGERYFYANNSDWFGSEKRKNTV
jgi:hypothetical protein